MVNTCNFIGRVVKKPELKDMGQYRITNFTLAINKKVNGESKATFLDFTAFNKPAEIICQYTDKGKMLYVEGEAQERKKEIEGKSYSFVNFLVKEFKFIGD